MSYWPLHYVLAIFTPRESMPSLVVNLCTPARVKQIVLMSFATESLVVFKFLILRRRSICFIDTSSFTENIDGMLLSLRHIETFFGISRLQG